MSATDIHRAIEAVWRIEAAKVIAGLTRMVRDLDLAEDLAQEALVVGAGESGRRRNPAKPGAWLMTTAKHRAIDHFREDRPEQRSTKSSAVN